ncbi:hypothetical protein FQN57_004056 [Myotisia sp. PD_48]|nr:hypothetical protein FQN57_004056 [Myotisia sp. PD_48]
MRNLLEHYHMIVAQHRGSSQGKGKAVTISRQTSGKTMTTQQDEKLRSLEDYSACDISDALLKLESSNGIPCAGFLADIVPFSPYPGREDQPRVVGYASTFKFAPKREPLPAEACHEGKGIPPGTHWVDSTLPNTIVLIDQPDGQKCAALGGIMATRMKILGAKAAIVNGRVRDLGELRSLSFPVWARATSTVGTNAESKPALRNVTITIGACSVSPGDIVVCDPLDGVVVIPNALLDDVLLLLPKLVEADSKVKEDVMAGATVFDAFQKHRGKN